MRNKPTTRYAVLLAALGLGLGVQPKTGCVPCRRLARHVDARGFARQTAGLAITGWGSSDTGC